MHTLTLPRGALVGCFGLLAMVGCSADDKPAIDAAWSMPVSRGRSRDLDGDGG